MKKYLTICVTLALFALTSCNESYDALDDVQQTAEQINRKELDDALNKLSETYDRNVVVVETPTANNSVTIAKVEEAMQSISEDKKKDCYVVVSTHDVYLRDIIDELTIMSQRPEVNIPSGSHKFLTGEGSDIPCDITVSWEATGVGVSASDSFTVVHNGVHLYPMNTYYEISGYFSIIGCADSLGAPHFSYGVSGNSNDDSSFEIHYYANPFANDTTSVDW